MYGTHNISPADEEVFDVLIAISHVSARLARKLTILAAQIQSEEEGKHHEQNERYDRNHRRARSATAAINDATDWLTRQFSSESDLPEEVPAPELKLEDVQTVLADIFRKGHSLEIQTLLRTYGAAKLSGIDLANYNVLLKDVESLNNAK